MRAAHMPGFSLITGYDPDWSKFQGADQLAFEWALGNGHPAFPFPAPWKIYGRRAGPLRNSRMLGWGRPSMVVAFPGGDGTADMVAQAKKAGVFVREIASLKGEG
jgi:hypothetical protein